MKYPESLPRVAVVIVNYKGREDTRECLQSLQELTYSNVCIYVVDQASDDGMPDMVRIEFPDAHVIENPVNNGFAGGNNVGIEAALKDGAEYVFLLNNDTTVAPTLLEPLINVMQTDANVGVCGSLMLYHSDPDIVWSAGGKMGPMGESVMLHQSEAGRMVAEIGLTEVDFVVGCGLMTSKSVLERIGLLDEQYFLYYEEADFCARVREASLRVVTVPTSRLWHKVSRTTGTDSLLTLYYMRRNVLLYLSRHQSRRAVGRAVLDSFRLAAVWSVRGKKNRAAVVLRAVRDFARSRFGPSHI